MRLEHHRTLRSALRMALLPLLLLAALPAQGFALCALSDAPLHTCCCPAHATREAPVAELSTSCCCKLEPGRTSNPPSAALRAPNDGAHGLLHATAQTPRVAPPSRSANGWAHPLAEARGGPKLFILHRSLLI